MASSSVLTTPAIERLASEVAAILGNGTHEPTGDHPAPAVMRRLREVLTEALADPALVPDPLNGPLPLPPTGVGKYLLHRSDPFVLFCTITAPGSVLAPHDHGSWGLVGMYQGVEEEVLYVPLGGNASDAAAEGGNHDGPVLVPLAEARRVVHLPGSISVIRPPLADIHRLANLGDENSISIHLFGRDPVVSGFRTFAPVHAVHETGPLDYDEIPPPPSPVP